MTIFPIVVPDSSVGFPHLLESETSTITKNVNNTGVNVQTDTNQKQDCLTAGGTSGLANSCQGTSTDTVTQSGGILHK